RLAAHGEDLTVAEALRQEFTVGAHLMRASDMPEGIRALLVDKDKDPKWSPARLEDVTADAVAAHFEPVPGVAPLELS
ncbi:enoyl-CoA hydratase/isomerase family protein, partial [Micrococcus endophyticus]